MEIQTIPLYCDNVGTWDTVQFPQAGMVLGANLSLVAHTAAGGWDALVLSPIEVQSIQLVTLQMPPIWAMIVVAGDTPKDASNLWVPLAIRVAPGQLAYLGMVGGSRSFGWCILHFQAA